jgi:hypothetical protein
MKIFACLIKQACLLAIISKGLMIRFYGWASLNKKQSWKVCYYTIRQIMSCVWSDTCQKIGFILSYDFMSCDTISLISVGLCKYRLKLCTSLFQHSE